MAYLTQQQVKDIINNAPANVDKVKLIQKLASQNTLQGYNEPQTQSQQDGFISSVVKDPIKQLIVRPGVRIGQALVGLGAEAFGSEQTKQRADQFAQADQKVHIPILGDYTIEGQKMGMSGVKQIGGDALKSASYLYTPGAASSAFKGATTAGQVIKTAAIQGAKSGAMIGGMYNAGDSLQQNQSLGDTLSNTLKGALGGAVVGGATSAAVTGAIQGFNSLKDKAAQTTIAKYDELFSNTKAGKNLLDKSSQQGKSPSKFLVEHNFIVDVEKGKINATPTIDKIQTHAQQYDDVLDQILQVKDETLGADQISLQSLGNKVKEKLASNPQNKASGYLNQQYKQVNGIINDLTSQYGDTVNLQTLNQIKQAQWKQASVFDATRPNYSKDIHYNFGSVAKNTIEDLVQQVDVKSLNNYIGDHYNAIKNLQRLDGKTVKGGRLGGYFGRVVGSIAGSSHGPVGAIMGAQIGDSVSTIMQNNYLSNPLKKILLARIPQESPMFADAQAALAKLKTDPLYGVKPGNLTEQTIVPAKLGRQPMGPLVKVNNYNNPYPKYITPDQITKQTNILQAKKNIGKSFDIGRRLVQRPSGF